MKSGIKKEMKSETNNFTKEIKKETNVLDKIKAFEGKDTGKDNVKEESSFKEKIASYNKLSEVKVKKESSEEFKNKLAVFQNKNSKTFINAIKSKEVKGKESTFESKLAYENAIKNTHSEKPISHVDINKYKTEESRVKNISDVLATKLTPSKIMNVKYADQKPELMQELKELKKQAEEDSDELQNELRASYESLSNLK